MSICKLVFSTLKLPWEILNPSHPARPDRLRLIEATSNLGGAEPCAPTDGAFITPTTIGNAKASIPVAAKAAFLARFSLSPILLDRMASILFLRFEPVIPETHFKGDSTYSLQTLRIPW